MCTPSSRHIIGLTVRLVINAGAAGLRTDTLARFRMRWCAGSAVAAERQRHRRGLPPPHNRLRKDRRPARDVHRSVIIAISGMSRTFRATSTSLGRSKHRDKHRDAALASDPAGTQNRGGAALQSKLDELIKVKRALTTFLVNVAQVFLASANLPTPRPRISLMRSRSCAECAPRSGRPSPHR